MTNSIINVPDLLDDQIEQIINALREGGHIAEDMRLNIDSELLPGGYTQMRDGIKNETYRIQLTNGVDVRDIVLKIYTRHSESTVKNIQAIQHAVHEQAGIRVPDILSPPMKLTEVVRESDPPLPECYFLVKEFVTGHSPEEMDHDALARTGQTMGTLHAASGEIDAHLARAGKSLSPTYVGIDVHLTASRLENSGLYTNQLQRAVRCAGLADDGNRFVSIKEIAHTFQRMVRLKGKIHDLDVRKGWLHSDFNAGNLIFGDDDELPTLIDWENAKYHYFIYDIARALWQLPLDTSSPEAMAKGIAAFLQGYADKRTLEPEEKENLVLLVDYVSERHAFNRYANWKVERNTEGSTLTPKEHMHKKYMLQNAIRMVAGPDLPDSALSETSRDGAYHPHLEDNNTQNHGPCSDVYLTQVQLMDGGLGLTGPSMGPSMMETYIDFDGGTYSGR